ncbi:hypothetical protein GUITHDRAFT_70524, partial [Guillardia theta CCMP2712]
VCMDFKTFVCMTCSGIHREFQHKCKGISLSNWTKEEVAAIEQGGNTKAQEEWMACWSEKDFPIPESGDKERIRTFIQKKYVDRKWHISRKRGSPNPEPISNILPEEPKVSPCPCPKKLISRVADCQQGCGTH